MTRLISAQDAIGRATVLIVGLSFAAKALAMLKEMYVATIFGATAPLDAFNIAYGFPGILALTLSGAVSSGFVPLYVQWRSMGPREADFKFRSLFYCSILASTALSAICLVLVPWLYPLFGYGLPRELQGSAIALGRPLMLFLLFEGLCILPSGYLHARKNFVHLHLSLMFPSIAIMACLFFSHQGNMNALIGGVVLGSLMKFCYVLYAVLKYGMSMSIRYPLDLDAGKRLAMLVLPLLGSELIANVNIFLDQVMATELSEGSVSVLRYAYRVNDIPIQLVIMAISKAILPYLSELAVEKEGAALREMYFLVVTAVGFLSIPVSAVFSLHSEEIVRILFLRGAFSEQMVQATARTLLLYNVGLVFYAYSFVNASFFFALQEMKPMFYLGCLSVVLNAVFNYIGMRWIGVGGIALSTSLTLLVVCVIFMKLLQHRLQIISLKRLVNTGMILGLSTAMMVLASLGMGHFFRGFAEHASLGLFLSLAVEATIYLSMSYRFRSRDMARLFDVLGNALHVQPQETE